MEKRNQVMVVSADPELHRFLEIVASTYSIKILGVQSPKKGLNLFRSGRPSCVIFDLDILCDPPRNAVKKKLQESGVPILFLNDREDEEYNPGASHTSLRVDPIVQFVLDNHNKSRRNSKKSPLKRFLFSLGVGRNRSSHPDSISV